MTVSVGGETSGNFQQNRLDRAWLAAATFPDVVTWPVRFTDMDILQHVNNAAAINMLQEARITFMRELAVASMHTAGLRSLVGSMTVEYAAELNYPGTVEIGTGVLRFGTSSYSLAQVLRQDGVPAVYSLITMVVSDGKGAAPIPDRLRAMLTEKGMIRG